MIFILSFAVFGASGVERPFPKVGSITLVPLGSNANDVIQLVGRKSSERKC